MIATVLFQVGGILGTLALAWLADRFGPAPVLGSAYLGGTILVAAVGQTGSEVALLFPAVFAAGFCLAGAQIGTHALSAMLYPAAVRATGFGWALGVGRAGSIVGPLLGGIMLEHRWPTPSVFLAAAIPPLLACIAVSAIGRRG